jgi:hypothetical protein
MCLCRQFEGVRKLVPEKLSNKFVYGCVKISMHSQVNSKSIINIKKLTKSLKAFIH